MLEIYPNPSNGIVKLNLGSSRLNVYIYDQAGRVVKVLHEVNGKIDLSLPGRGNYNLVFVLPDGERVTRRLVVQ